jgi:hypothetical protein
MKCKGSWRYQLRVHSKTFVRVTDVRKGRAGVIDKEVEIAEKLRTLLSMYMFSPSTNLTSNHSPGLSRKRIELKGLQKFAAIFRLRVPDVGLSLSLLVSPNILKSTLTKFRLIYQTSTTTDDDNLFKSTTATMGMLPILPAYASGDLGFCGSSFVSKD